MALSSYTPPNQAYGSVQNAYQSFMGQPMTRYGTGGSTSTGGNQAPSVIQSTDYGPISYGQDINTLRPQADVTNINTWGNMDASTRIQNLADRKFQDWASNQQAERMAAQSLWRDSWNTIGSLPRNDQSLIFNAMRNTGLVAQQPTQYGTQEYRSRQQNPWIQQNINTIGMTNRFNLANQGINPNSVQTAYNRFLNSV